MPRHRAAGPILALLAGLLAGGLSGVALAQTGPAQPGQGQPPLPPAPPERIEPAPRSGAGGPTGNDIQERSGIARGVVPPPAGVDPGIQTPAPVPNPGTTPVIPPPGTPGGDPTVQPR